MASQQVNFSCPEDRHELIHGEGGQGGPDPPPLKIHKNIGFFLAILVCIKATKPAFNVRPSSAHQGNTI